MASPLILRGMYVGKTDDGVYQYAPAALLLPVTPELYRNKLKLRHAWKGKGLEPFRIIDWWPCDPAAAQAATAGIDPMSKEGGGKTNPLEAFLHYFENA